VGSASRFADAQRLRDWIKATKGADTSASATF
jgi:hypothetical protein